MKWENRLDRLVAVRGERPDMLTMNPNGAPGVWIVVYIAGVGGGAAWLRAALVFAASC